MEILPHELTTTKKMKQSFYKKYLEYSWLDAFYSFFRYELTNLFKNIWLFRKDLWKFRWYDYGYTLNILQTSLEAMEKGMHNGYEVPESRNKKIAKMQRSIQILNNIKTTNYYELAENELHLKYTYVPFDFEPLKNNPEYFKLVSKESKEVKETNRKISDRAREIEQSEWNELWDIFKGRDINEYIKLRKENEKDNGLYDNWFDGSGMLGWWD